MSRLNPKEYVLEKFLKINRIIVKGYAKQLVKCKCIELKLKPMRHKLKT